MMTPDSGYIFGHPELSEGVSGTHDAGIYYVTQSTRMQHEMNWLRMISLQYSSF